MESFDEIIKSVDTFKSNVKEISLILDSLDKINRDYQETLDAPRNILHIIEDVNKNQSKSIDDLLLSVKRMIEDIKTYDALISDSIKSSINSSLNEISTNNLISYSDLRDSTLNNINKVASIQNKLKDEINILSTANEKYYTQVLMFNELLSNFRNSISSNTDSIKQVVLESSSFNSDIRETTNTLKAITQETSIKVREINQNLSKMADFATSANSIIARVDSIKTKLESLEKENKASSKLLKLGIIITIALLIFIGLKIV